MHDETNGGPKWLLLCNPQTRMMFWKPRKRAGALRVRRGKQSQTLQAAYVRQSRRRSLDFIDVNDISYVAVATERKSFPKKTPFAFPECAIISFLFPEEI